MKIEVAYAKPDIQVILPLEVSGDIRVEAAIHLSGILERFPEIDLAHNRVGIFGKTCDLAYALRDGDRVEIYRDLIADPKESRRNRAANTPVN